MVLPPFFFKNVSDQGLLDYYERFIERVNRTDLRIYLYHIPQVSGVGLSIDLIKILKEKYPTVIVGIKDSSGDWTHTEQLLLMEDFIVYPGSELPLVEAMRLGAPGCISATANLNTQQILNVISHCERHDWKQAVLAHDLAVESSAYISRIRSNSRAEGTVSKNDGARRVAKCTATVAANARTKRGIIESPARRFDHLKKIGLNSAETTLSQIFNPEFLCARTSLMLMTT